MAKIPHCLAIVLLSASFAAGPVAESPQQPVPAQTVIDFTAVGKDGQPVLDLASKEITLKVDGRQREIKFFQLLRAAEGPSAPAASAVAPPFATNIVAETLGRDVLVIIDEESISAGKQGVAQDAVRDFITSLGPADRAVLLSPRQGGPRINLSDTRGDLREALGRFSAFAPSVQKDEPCRTTIALISGGIASPPEGGREFARMGSGQCALNLDHFHQAGAAGRALQGDLYVIYAPEPLFRSGTSSLATLRRRRTGHVDPSCRNLPLFS